MKIISGGQSGADRGGLDAAIELGLEHAGWCPAGRRAEDGTIPEQYQLVETTSAHYLPRTRMNVADADATIIFTRGPLRGGSQKTQEFAKEEGKPYLWLNTDMMFETLLQELSSFLKEYQPKILNVAGSRESKVPGLQVLVRAILVQALPAHLEMNNVEQS